VRQIVDSGPPPVPVTPAWLLELDPRERLAALDRQLRRAQHDLATLTRRQALAQQLQQLSRHLRPDR
jgi:hypothetical protein